MILTVMRKRTEVIAKKDDLEISSPLRIHEGYCLIFFHQLMLFTIRCDWKRDEC
jgi:hypothetical protein